jgi:DhnA family fructose-bisphosphate aldolase class Ia
MSSTGKALRLRRIIDPASHTSLMFAFSHGTSAPQVMPGLEEPAAKFEAIRDGGADCIFIAPGLIHTLAPLIEASRDVAIVAKITSTASRGGVRHQERLIASVAHCAELGVDGVVAMIPFAPENEPDLISLAAEIGEACDRFGMPYIAEAEYPNAYYKVEGDIDYAQEWGLPYLKRSARLCAELGADIVKSNWPGRAEQFAEIVESVSVPVVVAGGSRESDLDLLQKVADARSAGAIGCSVGRNIFQHDRPAAITAALSAVVRGSLTPERALEAHLPQAQPVAS